MVLFAEILFESHIKIIGVIAVRWAAIDGDIYKILRIRFLWAKEENEFRYCNAGTNRLHYFNKQIKSKCIPPPEEINALIESINSLIELYKERNLIVHGQYGMTIGADNSLCASYSDIKLSKDDPSVCHLEPAPVTVDHLQRHADAVSAAARPLRDFLYQRPKTEGD